MSTGLGITLLAAGVLVVYWIVPWAGALLGMRAERRAGRFVRNYRGVDVPLGLGWAWAALGAVFLLGVVGTGVRGLMPGMLVLGAAFFGWLDDRFGADGPKGFRGHLSALSRGRLTTGLAKLAGVGVLSLAAAWAIAPPSMTLRSATSWLLAAAVIALTANLVNLLDLRPGRALKAYAAIALPAALAYALELRPAADAWGVASRLLLLAPVYVGPAAVLLPYDLGERAMLGDMGANAAGAYAGYVLASAVSPSVPAAGIAAAVLLALNLASERVSFSAVIEGNRVLRWFDGLGRPALHSAEQRTQDGETGT